MADMDVGQLRQQHYRLVESLQRTDKRIGFYGLDVYSFSESMNSIIEYLEKNDLKALAQQRQLECFEPYSKDEGQLC
jgi:erythromycin esterase-like protein